MPAVLRLIGIVISIGLADSLNPTTIAPALYLATGERGRGRVVEFTLGVFAVYLVGGLAVALGPGQLLLSLLPRPSHRITHLIEIGVGLAMIGGASLLWRHRVHLARREPPDLDPNSKSSLLLGVTIAAVELPTAFPYFAVIAATVGSGVDAARQLMLILLFNLFFILPLLGIIATLTFAGDHAERLLAVGRDFLQRRWPVVLAGLALLAGIIVVFLGATGIAGNSHGHFGRFIRHLRHVLHP
jgi:cytochrome c biogenesis protein CcdA